MNHDFQVIELNEPVFAYPCSCSKCLLLVTAIWFKTLVQVDEIK